MTKPMLGPIACILLACMTAPAKSLDDAIAATANILEDHLTEEISCKWYGGESVCLFGPHQVTRAGVQIDLFLEAVNRANDSDFKLTKEPWHHGSNAPWHTGHPDFTMTCAMVGTPLGAKALADIVESQDGSRPQSTYVARNRLREARGFTLRIQGKRREFVNVYDSVPPVSCNPDPARSIMTYERTHALKSLGEFEADTVVSLLGEMSDVAYYDDWFDSNLRGLCLADLMLLEKQVGRAFGQFSRRAAPLDWLENHAHALRELAPVLQAELADFMDLRCQG